MKYKKRSESKQHRYSSYSSTQGELKLLGLCRLHSGSTVKGFNTVINVIGEKVTDHCAQKAKLVL